MTDTPGPTGLPAVLLASGLIDAEQLEHARAEQEMSGVPLGRALVLLGYLSETELVRALAGQIGLEFVDLAEQPVDPAAAAVVPAAVCMRHAILPFAFRDGVLLLAMADPGNVFALDDVRRLAGSEVRALVGTREDILTAIDRAHRADADVEVITSALEADNGPGEDALSARDAVDDSPIVKYVNMIIMQAVRDGASDVHVEPHESGLRIRYRIDGVLHEVMESPRSIASGVTSRLKIMSEMDIAERRRPQDGRLSVTTETGRVDLRVATLPTVWGEKVVMRILDNSATRLALTDLGFTGDNHERFRTGFAKPHGMVLVTGPTGSGKSTTLYAALNVVSRPEVNVITVEDPVEYRLPGINQVQINSKAGLTFAAALRSILRSDPDVVLLGEIRDHETALISVEAALTGHLVMSTLHTNDAPSAVTRLVEMGVEPFLVGSALECVLAQRLARRLCAKCTTARPAGEEERAVLGAALADGLAVPGLTGPGVPDDLQLNEPVGCAACARTGYRGRVALHEVMTVTEEIERLCVSRAPATEIARSARAQGMVPLRADGLGKVVAGLTTLEEILRVVA